MKPPPEATIPVVSHQAIRLLEDFHSQGNLPASDRAGLLEEARLALDRFTPEIELRLGQVLAPMLRGGHKHLGWVTPASFCREELGISATSAWDLARLAESLPGRPVLLAAFLEGRLPRSHALELLRLPPGDDEAWVTRALGMPVQELRRAAAPHRPSPSGRDDERRVRDYDLDPEAYATWLTAVELTRRREGRDLGPAAVLEQVLAELLAGPLGLPEGARSELVASLGEQDATGMAPFLGPEGPSGLVASLGEQDATPGGTAVGADGSVPEPPAFVKRAEGSPGPSVDGADGGPGPSVGGAEGGQVPGASAEAAGPTLPACLQDPLPRSPRRLTRVAVGLLRQREQTDLLLGRLLRRVQEGRLYRETGHRTFRAWLAERGIAASTAFQATSRDLKLDSLPQVRETLLDGRLNPTKVDLLLRLLPKADAASWIAYAETRTCRRLEEAVEAALVLAARWPLAWARRGRTAPGDEETLEEFRRQAGLAPLECALDDLARAFGAVEAGVQTSAMEAAHTSTAGMTPAAPGVQASAAAPLAPALEEGATAVPGVQTSAATSPVSPPPGDPSRNSPASLPGTVQTSVQVPATIRLRVVLPAPVDDLLRAAEARLRQDAPHPLSAEDCLQVLLFMFLRQGCPEQAPAMSRLRRLALERAGYRCEVPGCPSRTNLHVHHIVRRSQGGKDELPCLAVLCSAHHLRHIHGGTMRVEGDEPATRIWETGIQDGEPWRVWLDEKLIDGAALAEAEELPAAPVGDVEEWLIPLPFAAWLRDEDSCGWSPHPPWAA